MTACRMFDCWGASFTSRRMRPSMWQRNWLVASNVFALPSKALLPNPDLSRRSLAQRVEYAASAQAET